MHLNHGLHLAYCTNIHRGQTWAETFDSLNFYVLPVRNLVHPGGPFAIGLRLSHRAAVSLYERKTLLQFQRWLDRHDCYVFTINGFPYGRFHGTRVKEQVYSPDWSKPARLVYTNLLFDLLARLLPPGVEGSVSTLPGSFKEFIETDQQERLIRRNLWQCVEHVERVSRRTRRQLHLGLEPEPLGLIENTEETIAFFEQMRQDRPGDERINKFLGITYDACHFAIEYEEPQTAMAAFEQAGIKISKIHLSSALKTRPDRKARTALKQFADDVYLHQVVARERTGRLRYYRDLPDALSANTAALRSTAATEWRIHFHVPLHAPAMAPFKNTNDHLLRVMDLLARNPKLCGHLEMETYTWEVLPPKLKSAGVEDQLAAEYDWTLNELVKRGLARSRKSSTK